MKRWHIFFSGHVQGVGFRYACLQAAQQYDARGWVRNLNDGRVEMMIEGCSSDLLLILERIEDRMPGHVTDRHKAELPVAEGELLSKFQILR